MKLPICARKSALTCTTSPAALDWTDALVANFCTPAPALAARASRRTPWHSSARLATLERRVRLIETVVDLNDARKIQMADRVVAACGGSVRGLTIGILGLTFKPETDDMREAPSIPIITELLKLGATVRAFDPQGMNQARPLLPSQVNYCRNGLEVALGANALVVITEWNEFRAISPARLRELMVGNVIVDLRNIFDPQAMRVQGFEYSGIGRGKARAGGKSANPSNSESADNSSIKPGA